MKLSGDSRHTKSRCTLKLASRYDFSHVPHGKLSAGLELLDFPCKVTSPLCAEKDLQKSVVAEIMKKWF